MIYTTTAVRSVSKQGHLQLRCHSKASSLSRQLLNGLLSLFLGRHWGHIFVHTNTSVCKSISNILKLSGGGCAGLAGNRLRCALDKRVWMGCQRNLCWKETHWWASILSSRVRNGTETGINSCLMEHLAGLRLLVLTLKRTRLHQDYGCPKDAPSLKSAQRNFLQGCY